MNAYDLANKLDAQMDIPQVSNMLRKQADQIAELKLNLGLSEHLEKKSADRIAELEKQLDLHKNAHHKAVEILREKTKPLSDEEMEDIESRVYAKTISKGKPMGIYAKTLCRAIEERILRK